MRRHEIKEQRQDIPLGFYYLYISTGDHPQPAIPYFVFCIYTEVIFFGSKQPTLSKAQQNIPELFMAVSASAMISTRTGHWHYTHLDNCRDAQSCLRQHLSCVLSCKRVPEPHWSPCLRLSVTAEHCLSAAESHKEGTATPWCKI